MNQMKLDQIENRRHYIYLIGIYCIVHLFLLLNKSIFWDDWIWFLNPDQYEFVLHELGIVFLKSLFLVLIQQPIFQIKLLVFLCYLLSGLLFFESLKLLKIFDNKMSFWVSILFMILPFNILARAAVVSTLIYPFSFLFFFFGFWLYLKFRRSQTALEKRLFLIVSFGAITLSFNTASIMLVYILALLAAEVVLNRDLKRNEILKAMAVVGGLAFIHVLVFYFIKNSFFPAYGDYVGYNHVEISSSTIKHWLTKGIASAMMDPILFSFFGKTISSFISLKMRSLEWLLIWIPVVVSYRLKKYESMGLALTGIALALAAFFPYIAVGKTPDMYEWSSRHALLMPLGTSLWLGSLLTVFNSVSAKVRFRNFLALSMVLIFSQGTIRLYLAAQGFRYQDISLQNALVDKIDTREPAIYLLNGESSPGVSDRVWRTYEIQGMLYSMSGQQNHLIIPKLEWSVFSNADFNLMNSEYKKRMMIGQVKWAEPFYCLSIQELKPMNDFNILFLLISEYWEPAAVFAGKLKQFYDFKKTQLDIKTLHCLDKN